MFKALKGLVKVILGLKKPILEESEGAILRPQDFILDRKALKGLSFLRKQWRLMVKLFLFSIFHEFSKFF